MTAPPLEPLARREFPLADADRCVKCGLCLPHCPTYRLAEEEAESPRGRIALLQGLVTGALPLTERTREHLDNCLLCRACERACPADVPYGALMDAGRALYSARHPHRRAIRWRNQLLTHPRPLATAATLAWLAQRGGLMWLARAGRLTTLFRVEDAAALLPPLEHPRVWPRHVPARGEERGRVFLFLGCVARHTDARALRLALRVLPALGFAVDIPAGQRCCGAMDAHAGLVERASTLAAENRALFPAGATVVHLATACGAQLRETLADPVSGAAPAAVELTRFLADADWPREPATLSGPGGEPLQVRGHLPCSARNALRDSTAIADLMARLPGVEYAELPGNDRCCGASGTYMLDHPETARALRADKVAAADGDQLLTTNPGCALHLGSGLRERRGGPTVSHPVELVARALNL
ncbi:MAG: (Fe-S)-binding protein [Pseudomonadota bacterium]